MQLNILEDQDGNLVFATHEVTPPQIPSFAVKAGRGVLIEFDGIVIADTRVWWRRAWSRIKRWADVRREDADVSKPKA